MKKTILILLGAFTALFSLESFELGKRRDGTDPGHTGSPGDSLKTCIVCHGGVKEWQPNWITSNIPETGFEPGKTYTITATNTNPGYNIFGFQVSPQDKEGKLLGEIILTNTNETKLVGNNKYITYTSFGVDGQNSKSWSFDWKAPDASVNEVTFYGAFNSNMDGHKFSDKTTVSNLRVFKQGFTSIAEKVSTFSEWKFYRSFGSNQINISGLTTESGDLTITMYTLEGKQIWGKSALVQTGANHFTENIELATSGIYLFTLSLNGKQLSKKVYIP